MKNGGKCVMQMSDKNVEHAGDAPTFWSQPREKI